MSKNKKYLKTALLSSILLSSVIPFSTAKAINYPIIYDRNDDPCAVARAKARQNKNVETGENSSAREKIIELASNDFKNAKYSQSNRWEYGKSADCSSFVAMIYEKALGLSRDDFGGYTVAQEKSVKKISKDDAKAGDLCFWGKDGNTHHVAIYDGNGGVYEMKDPTYNFGHTELKNYGEQPSFFATLNPDKNKALKEAYDKLNKTSSSSSSTNNSGSSSSKGEFLTVGGSHRMLKTTADETYKYWSKRGLGYKQIAGILGNWAIESMGQPYSIQGIIVTATPQDEGEKIAESNNNRSTGIGLGQWTANRNAELRDYAKSKNKKWYKADVQVPYTVDEMNGHFQYVFKELGNKDSVESATRYFMDEWERPGVPVWGERLQSAEDIAKYFEENKMTAKVDKDKLSKLKGGSDSGGAFDTASDDGATKSTNMCGIEMDDGNGGNDDFSAGGGWVFPIKGASISSPFGHRDLAGSPWHDGIDIGFAQLGSGRDILAVHNAKVQYAGSPAKYGQPTGLPFGLGNYIIVLSTGEYEIVYQEFAMDGSKSKVKTGDIVKKGQVIYENAKQSGAVDHLHIGVLKGKGDDWSKAQADWQNPNSKYWLDPQKFFKP